MTKEEAIKRWKELGIVRCSIPFSCGGDSMNDLTVELYKENDELVKDEELEVYFDDQVYINVDFYVNSDGHYNGEHGTVEVTLENIELEDADLEDADLDFTYVKNSVSEYSERVTEIAAFELSEDELDFVNKYVSNINGDNGGNFTINYKLDFIVTDELQDIENELKLKLETFVSGFEFKDAPDGEPDDFRTFTTNDDNEELTELTIVDGKLQLIVNDSILVERED